jgi:hypothetical protein
VNGEPVRARVIVVGNNTYELSLFTLGERARIDAGELSLSTAAGWLPTTWEEQTARAFRIETGGTLVRAAIDGEPVVLEAPLELECLPGALRLLLPAEEGEAVMHDNPEPTEREQELANTDRQNEEEAARYPSDAQPDAPSEDAEE